MQHVTVFSDNNRGTQFCTDRYLWLFLTMQLSSDIVCWWKRNSFDCQTVFRGYFPFTPFYCQGQTVSHLSNRLTAWSRIMRSFKWKLRSCWAILSCEAAYYTFKVDPYFIIKFEYEILKFDHRNTSYKSINHAIHCFHYLCCWRIALFWRSERFDRKHIITPTCN